MFVTLVLTETMGVTCHMLVTKYKEGEGRLANVHTISCWNNRLLVSRRSTLL